MTTPLQKTLKRELTINGRAFIVAISPEGLKMTLKGRRKGLEVQWEALVSGDTALVAALNASREHLSEPPASAGAQQGAPSTPKTERGPSDRS